MDVGSSSLFGHDDGAAGEGVSIVLAGWEKAVDFDGRRQWLIEKSDRNIRARFFFVPKRDDFFNLATVHLAGSFVEGDGGSDFEFVVRGKDDVSRRDRGSGLTMAPGNAREIDSARPTAIPLRGRAFGVGGKESVVIEVRLGSEGLQPELTICRELCRFESTLGCWS